MLEKRGLWMLQGRFYALSVDYVCASTYGKTIPAIWCREKSLTRYDCLSKRSHAGKHNLMHLRKWLIFDRKWYTNDGEQTPTMHPDRLNGVDMTTGSLGQKNIHMARIYRILNWWNNVSIYTIDLLAWWKENNGRMASAELFQYITQL